MTDENNVSITGKFSEAGAYFKAKFAEVFGDSVPNVARDSMYAISDLFGLPEGIDLAYSHVMSVIEGNVSPVLDFSTPESSAVSLAKMALSGATIAVGVDTGRRLGKGIKYLKQYGTRPD